MTEVMEENDKILREPGRALATCGSGAVQWWLHCADGPARVGTAVICAVVVFSTELFLLVARARHWSVPCVADERSANARRSKTSGHEECEVPVPRPPTAWVVYKY